MKNFRELMEASVSKEDKEFQQKVDSVAKTLESFKIKYKTFATGKKYNRHYKIGAYIKNKEIGSVWIRDYGDGIGVELNDADGLFELEEFIAPLKKEFGV